MSILIKGMEMPTSCYDCNCFIRDSDGSDYCCLLMQDIEDNRKRDDDCPLVPYWEPYVQTNADRIRAMTDEELAEWINNEYGSTDWCPVDAPVDPVTRKCLVHDDCAECIVDWLKQEAE